jgi:murein DD-endopeptidase MepM/ murein hydrolase activator NlpD
MNEGRLHIIITGETGKGRTLLVDRKNIRRGFISIILVALFLCIGTLSGIHHWNTNRALKHQVAKLSQSLDAGTGQLIQELTSAKAKLAKIRLEKLKVIDRYESQIAELQREKAKLFAGSINRLDERSKIIKTVIDQIGIKLEFEDDPNHSGGLYIDPDAHTCDKLINNTDRYLALLQHLPLGRPISTKISSRYGARIDPLKHKKAFHAGVDFKGHTGDKVRSTGDGIVKRSVYNGGFGNCIILSHGNGYDTLYAHLSKRLVKRGEKVSRGQVIGLVGSTGRSTGSHLHYEVHYHNKTVNPMKFLRVAKLLPSKK